jgi:biopolymer transport protein ExbD
MKVLSPVPHRKARIEIIPLIDIMFFLLASFMMASLALMRLQAIRMNLPTATVSTKTKSDMVKVHIDKNGDVSIDKRSYTIPELRNFLTNQVQQNSNVPVYIQGDDLAKHGVVINILDIIRQTGIENVSFAITAEPQKTANR